MEHGVREETCAGDRGGLEGACVRKAQQLLNDLSELVGDERLERSNCAAHGALACELIQASVG